MRSSSSRFLLKADLSGFYEALKKGRLPSADGTDYVANDDFVASLAAYDVEFYATGTRAAATNTDWLTEYQGA